MVIFLSSYVVFRQIYLFIASRLTDSFLLVTFAYPAGWIMCSFLMFLYYRKRSKVLLDAISASA